MMVSADAMHKDCKKKGSAVRLTPSESHGFADYRGLTDDLSRT